MSLPFALVLGLLAMAIQGTLGNTMPTDPSPWRALAFAPLLCCPCAWALFALPSLLPYRLGAARLGGWLVPLCYSGFAFGTDLAELAVLRCEGSRTLELLIVAGPLFLAEVALRIGEHFAVVRAPLDEVRRWYLPQMGFEKLPMVGFLASSLFVCAVGTDLLFLRRKLAAFVTETSLGMTLGAGLVLVLFAVLLPLMFRAFLPIRALPDNATTAVARDAAVRLGFPASNLKLLDTGHREINAALIGPLPWPRYLVLSDGLLALFLRDPLSLRGVVAHEIGHARAHHPAWLVVCVAILPLLWFAPLTRVLPEAAWPWWLWTSVLGTLVGLTYALHRLAHRFEHEADQLSAEVLGGADACVTALQRVGELFSNRNPKRGSLRHPSEEARVTLMLRNERDPVARERFWRNGRLIRSVLVAGVLVSIGFAAHAHARTWTIDRVRATFAEGGFPAADALLSRMDVDQLDDRERRERESLQALVKAAREIVPEGGSWFEIRNRLASAARVRGEAILARGHDENEAEQARVWFTLAAEIPAPSARVRTLHAWCIAMSEDRKEEARLLWQHAESLR